MIGRTSRFRFARLLKHSPPRRVSRTNIRRNPWRAPVIRGEGYADSLASIDPQWREPIKAILDATLTPLKPGDPRRHHYIPQFYLRRFAENEMVSLVRLGDGHQPFKVNVRNVAVQKDLYTVSADDVGDTAAVERIFSIIDGAASERITRLAYGVWFPPQLYDRAWLSLWLLLLHIRGPSKRRELEAITDYAMKLDALVRSQGHTDSETVDFMSRLNEFEFVAHQNTYVRLILSMLDPRIARILDRKRWVVWKFSQPGLVLTDRPLILSSAVPGLSVGLENADEIIVPLDRCTALALYNDRDIDETVIRDPQHIFVDQLNQRLVQQAASEIYCHPDDVDRLQQVQLPNPDDRTLFHVSPAGQDMDSVAFATDGINSPPERKQPRRYAPLEKWRS